MTCALTVGVVVAGIFCAVVALGVVTSVVGVEWWGKTRHNSSTAVPNQAAATGVTVGAETFPDPNAPGTPARIFVERSDFDGDIAPTAAPFAGVVRNHKSLDELREALRGKGRRGIAALRAQYDQLRLDSPPTLAASLQGDSAGAVDRVSVHARREVRARRPPGLSGRSDLSRRPEVSPDIQAEAACSPGCDRAAAGRDRELPGVRRARRAASSRSSPRPSTVSRPARARRSSSSPPTWSGRPATSASAGC